jgi:hypothetical protein
LLAQVFWGCYYEYIDVRLWDTQKIMNDRQRISVRQPPGLDVGKAANALGLTVSQLTIVAISEYLQKRGVNYQ